VAGPVDGGRRHRRAAVYTLVALATIVAVFAVLAVWVQRQALNTDNWASTSSELLDDPTIRTAVSGYLVDQLFTNADVTGELRKALPPAAKGLAGPAAGGLRQVADTATNEALQRPRVQALWEEANRRAHQRLIQVLDDSGQNVSTKGGEVTLDLGALLREASARIGVGSRLVARVQPGDAQIVLLRSNQLAFAQDVAHALKPLAIFLTGLAIVLYAAALALARGWRREALRAAGFGLIVAGVGALVARKLAGAAVVDGLTSTAASQDVAVSAWSIGTSLFVSIATATIAYGVVIVLAAWAAGRTRPAVALRRAAAPYLREPAYAYGALAVVVLLLLLWAPTQALRQWTTAIILVVFLVAGLEALRRQTAREFPDAEPGGLPASAGAADGRASPSSPAVAVTAPNAVPTTEASPADIVDRLERLAVLHDRGALTDDEFASEKRALLAHA
jgi:hypothetical protein